MASAWAAVPAVLVLVLVVLWGAVATPYGWWGRERFTNASQQQQVRFWQDAAKKQALPMLQLGHTGRVWVEVPALHYVVYGNRGDRIPKHLIGDMATGSRMFDVMFQDLSSIWSNRATEYALLTDDKGTDRTYIAGDLTPWAAATITAVRIAPKTILLLNPTIAVSGTIAYANDGDREAVVKLRAPLLVRDVALRPHTHWRERRGVGVHAGRVFEPYVTVQYLNDHPRIYAEIGAHAARGMVERVQISPNTAVQAFDASGRLVLSAANPHAGASDEMEEVVLRKPVNMASLRLYAINDAFVVLKGAGEPPAYLAAAAGRQDLGAERLVTTLDLQGRFVLRLFQADGKLVANKQSNSSSLTRNVAVAATPQRVRYVEFVRQ